MSSLCRSKLIFRRAVLLGLLAVLSLFQFKAAYEFYRRIPSLQIFPAEAWTPWNDSVKILSQQDVDIMARSLTVTYGVEVNGGAFFNFTVTMSNTGDGPIGGSDWEIYFCNIHMLFPSWLPYNPGGIEVGMGLRVAHVNGCLFRLFSSRPPWFWRLKSSVALTMVAAQSVVAKTDIMPNWYVISSRTEPRVIESTKGEDLSFVLPFDTAAKWKRAYKDQYNPITPAERFAYYKLNEPLSLPYNEPPRLVPSPAKVTASATKDLSNAGSFGSELALDNLPELVRLRWRKTLQFALSRLNASEIGAAGCNMQRMCIHFELVTGMASEGYSLSLVRQTQTVAITASGDLGALMAVKTLYQLISTRASFAELAIEDRPRYAYRGVMIDLARNFLSKAAIKTFIEVIALYKLNYLHLHLADDEGWRLQIDGLPELTEVGARSCHDLSETLCVLPMLGVHPSKSTARYLSKADYMDVLSYASSFGIKVVPEFDMPGHSHSAIKAMEARYKKLMADGFGESASSEYLLSDIGDKSRYMSVQQYTDNAMNPCMNSTYRFVSKVVQVVQGYHSAVDGQVLDFIHLGGDEVPHGAWINSSVCQTEVYSKLAFRSATDLKKYFVKNVYKIMSQAGLGLAMWEDGFMSKFLPYSLADISGSATAKPSLYAYVWQNTWESRTANRAHLLANAGYKVVLVPATHYYFDHPQEPDPDERGLYWATRFTGTNKTFSFMPDKIYNNANHDRGRFGGALSRSAICPSSQHSACPSLTRAGNIIGVQGAIWGETCRTEAHLHSLAFPRVLALAERAWHKADWENMDDLSADFIGRRNDDWASFATSIGQHQLPLLDCLGIVYHLNPPGVIHYNGSFTANAEFDGQAIEYSLDGGHTWKKYDAVILFVQQKEPVLFATAVTRGPFPRRSRAIQVLASP